MLFVLWRDYCPFVFGHRFCASGLTALQMAADRIRIGEADVMIAGGAESMSMVPMMGNAPSLSPTIFSNPEDIESYGIAYGMGLTAEKVAQQWKVSREAQDQFALESHLKALAAQQAGEFSDEMTAVDIVEKFPNLATGEIDVRTRTVSLDEGPRADSSLQGLAKLRPVFAAKGSVTAGNSSQTSDGAGALILVSEKILKQFNLTPLARFASFAVRGVRYRKLYATAGRNSRNGIGSTNSVAATRRASVAQPSMCPAVIVP